MFDTSLNTLSSPNTSRTNNTSKNMISKRQLKRLSFHSSTSNDSNEINKSQNFSRKKYIEVSQLGDICNITKAKGDIVEYAKTYR